MSKVHVGCTDTMAECRNNSRKLSSTKLRGDICGYKLPKTLPEVKHLKFCDKVYSNWGIMIFCSFRRDMAKHTVHLPAKGPIEGDFKDLIFPASVNNTVNFNKGKKKLTCEAALSSPVSQQQ